MARTCRGAVELTAQARESHDGWIAILLSVRRNASLAKPLQSTYQDRAEQWSVLLCSQPPIALRTV